MNIRNLNGEYFSVVKVSNENDSIFQCVNSPS